MAPRAESILLTIATVWMCATHSVATEELNVTESSMYLAVNRNGKTVYMSEDLMQKLEEELETWHWTPWLRTRTRLIEDVVREVSCNLTNSIDSFPDSIFTDEQLRNGAFILYVLFGIYAFTLLAIICNDFFVPCVELICDDLKIPQNVAAATFMSVATSCPEFFVNVISTFLTESSMGIGTIVGSAVFNALGVAAIGGLAAVTPIAIEMRPVTRDALIYMVNVSALVIIVWDGQVDWYEAVVLAVMYILYFVIMFNSMRLFALYDKLIGKCCEKEKNSIVAQSTVNGISKSVEEGIENKAFENEDDVKRFSTTEKNSIAETDLVSEKTKKSNVWRFPLGKSVIYQIWWFYSWPLRFVLGMTIPSPVRHRKWYPLSFLMCIVWIGVNSYFVSWSMTVIGHTFLIPDSVMGMTFLAFGGCLPEACSMFIMCRRGEGGIGVSNALGANSLAILFALGIPWLIRTLMLVAQEAEEKAVMITSSGIGFVVGSLLVAVTCLWVVLYIGKFMLRKSVGTVLLVLYILFITFAVLVETGVILEGTVEVC